MSDNTHLDKQAPLIEHLRELRNRFMYCVAAFFVAFFASYYFAQEIYQFLVAPLANAYGDEANRRLIFTGLTEAFVTYIKLSFFAGLVFSFPVIAYQVYAFIVPGLYKNEKKVFTPFLIASPLLFILGAALVYYFIFPLAWKFFLSFEVSGAGGAMPIQLEAKVSEYLSLVTGLIIAFGMAFQLPLILMLLAYAGFLTADGLKKKRKYAVVGIFTVAAIITPPDVISQIGLAIPLLLLYECAVWGCGFIERKKKDA